MNSRSNYCRGICRTYRSAFFIYAFSVSFPKAFTFSSISKRMVSTAFICSRVTAET